MVVKTRSARVDLSRKLVLELLGSSVDLSTTPHVAAWMDEYGARPERFGPSAPASPAGERDALAPGHHRPPDPKYAATVAQPTKIDNELYVLDNTWMLFGDAKAVLSDLVKQFGLLAGIQIKISKKIKHKF